MNILDGRTLGIPKAQIDNTPRACASDPAEAQIDDKPVVTTLNAEQTAAWLQRKTEEAQRVEDDRIRAKLHAKVDEWFARAREVGISEDWGNTLNFSIRCSGYGDYHEEIIYEVSAETNTIEEL